MLQVIEPIENRINEARDAVRQLLGLAYQANMIDISKDFSLLIQSLWATFASREQYNVDFQGLKSTQLMH